MDATGTPSRFSSFQAGIKATFCSAQSRVSKEEILYKSRQVFENSNMNYLPAWKELKRLGVPVASIYPRLCGAKSSFNTCYLKNSFPISFKTMNSRS